MNDGFSFSGGSDVLQSAGRLEIYLNDEWGTVCDDGFAAAEAETACRQLGYTDYADFGSDLG